VQCYCRRASLSCGSDICIFFFPRRNFNDWNPRRTEFSLHEILKYVKHWWTSPSAIDENINHAPAAQPPVGFSAFINSSEKPHSKPWPSLEHRVPLPSEQNFVWSAVVKVQPQSIWTDFDHYHTGLLIENGFLSVIGKSQSLPQP